MKFLGSAPSVRAAHLRHNRCDRSTTVGYPCAVHLLVASVGLQIQRELPFSYLPQAAQGERVPGLIRRREY